ARVLAGFALRGDAESAPVQEQRDELAALDEDAWPQRSRGDDVTGPERLRDLDIADVVQLRERIRRSFGRQAPIGANVGEARNGSQIERAGRDEHLLVPAHAKR